MVSWPAKKPPMTGPSTDAVPNTARKYPWYLARSRGGTMSPMIARASENRPPAPRPCTARKAARLNIDVAKVHSIDPKMKIEMAMMNSFLRP